MTKPNTKYQIPNTGGPRIAIVADWLYGGGAERVVEELHNLYPDAPVYASYCSDEWRERLDNKVITGYLQYPPFRQLRKFLPLLRQRWFSKLDLSSFDLVISSSGNGEAKFIKVPNGKHVCYCHTPVHFFWRNYEEYIRNPGFRPVWLARIGLKLLVKPLRKRDYQAAQKVNQFIANSSHIQQDIKTFYDKDSIIVHPPVDTGRFSSILNPRSSISKPPSGFVTVGRQVPMKKTDLVIKACNELNLPLTVIGRGPEHDRLVSMGGPTITFKTDVTDEQMPRELAKAEAFIFASFEDFGIAPIEAMAAGTPVIAYKAGGALDYVIPGKTGEFFEKQTSNSIKTALQSFNLKSYDTKELNMMADNFSKSKFRELISDLIKKYD